MISTFYSSRTYVFHAKQGHPACSMQHAGFEAIREVDLTRYYNLAQLRRGRKVANAVMHIVQYVGLMRSRAS
jgi:hypothetical protein